MAVKDLYDKACEAVNRGNHDYGIELYRQVLRLEPDHSEARVLLRGTERRRLGEGGRAFVRAIFCWIRGLWPLLKALLQFRDPQKRLERWEDFLKNNPNSLTGLRAAGKAARKAGHYEAAIVIFKDALSLRPNHKKTMRALGQVFEEGGKISEAVGVLAALAALGPYDQPLQQKIRNLEALQHMQATGMEGAESFRDLIRDKEAAEEGVRRHATDSERLPNLIAQARQALKDDPDSVSMIAALTRLYREDGQMEDAVQLLEEARQRLPDNYEIRELYGDLQLQMHEDALREIEKGLEKDPGDAELLKRKCDLQLQRKELAVQEYAWRVEQHPTDHELHLKLGRSLLNKGDYDGAIASCQIAVRDPRLEVRAASTLGQCFVAKKQYDLAVEQYKKAIARRPELDETGMEVYYLLASALELMDDKEEALKVYKKIYSNEIGFRDVAQKVQELSG